MNKTPIIFDLPSSITIDKLEIYSVSICTTGYKKTNFTVVLTCIADRIKLSPLIIFKFKNISRCNFPLEVIVRANLTGWMNKNEMLY